MCIEEYSKIARNEVQKAFFVNFESETGNLLNNYIDNAGAYLDDSKVENEWGEMVQSDEKLMRNVEEKVGITSSGKDSFRQEVYRKMIRSKSDGGDYDYKSHPKLKEALQKQLFEERDNTISYECMLEFLEKLKVDEKIVFLGMLARNIENKGIVPITVSIVPIIVPIKSTDTPDSVDGIPPLFMN